MRLWHSAAATSVQFDDENLVSYVGLVPVMRLAQDCGLAELVAEHLRVAGTLGANAPFKIGCVVGGMIAGADSIDDLDVLRHGGMGELFDGVRARPRWVRSCGRSRGATSAKSPSDTVGVHVPQGHKLTRLGLRGRPGSSRRTDWRQPKWHVQDHVGGGDEQAVLRPGLAAVGRGCARSARPVHADDDPVEAAAGPAEPLLPPRAKPVFDQPLPFRRE